MANSNWITTASTTSWITLDGMSLATKIVTRPDLSNHIWGPSNNTEFNRDGTLKYNPLLHIHETDAQIMRRKIEEKLSMPNSWSVFNDLQKEKDMIKCYYQNLVEYQKEVQIYGRGLAGSG